MRVTTRADVIQVWADRVPDAELWRDAGPELERPRWDDSRLVRNVSEPTLTIFLPEPSIALGTGVVVCPGGAFHFLMVDKEGSEVARWLNRRGVAAFVLRYRVAPTPDDDADFAAIASNVSQRRERMTQVQPHAVADGLQALRTVRQQAQAFGIDPDRLGILGFSAGGFVTAGAATEYDAESRPSFAAPIYALWHERPLPVDAPPLFLAASTDDGVVDVQSSLSLYSAWRAAGRPVELHLYSRGGHGFGMNQQGLPSDAWIDQFWGWLRAEGFVPE
ncbi:MAG: alpha/beta hydrolase [Chloroflexi bacterium]|nr:alpha/beta hydrolase [Chloroflexota bacterium]